MTDPNTTGPVTIRQTQPQDIPALIDLQRRTYPTIKPWAPERVDSQMAAFPQGQLVAELDGQLVGAASALVVLWDEWVEDHTWKEITARGTFDTHDTRGRTLYGAEVFVDGAMQGMGVGHLLYNARKQLCRDMNLKRIIACGRLPGYGALAHSMGVEMYCKKVLWGDITDPVLSFQLREGFRYCGVMPGYIPEDMESCGCASLIVWLNTDYDPAKPTLFSNESRP